MFGLGPEQFSYFELYKLKLAFRRIVWVEAQTLFLYSPKLKIEYRTIVWVEAQTAFLYSPKLNIEYRKIVWLEAQTVFSYSLKLKFEYRKIVWVEAQAIFLYSPNLKFEYRKIVWVEAQTVCLHSPKLKMAHYEHCLGWGPKWGYTQAQKQCTPSRCFWLIADLRGNVQIDKPTTETQLLKQKRLRRLFHTGHRYTLHSHMSTSCCPTCHLLLRSGSRFGQRIPQSCKIHSCPKKNKKGTPSMLHDLYDKTCSKYIFLT